MKNSNDAIGNRNRDLPTWSNILPEFNSLNVRASQTSSVSLRIGNSVHGFPTSDLQAAIIKNLKSKTLYFL
jgi:hypothetical protein